MCGLFVRHVPRITRPVQDLLASFARDRGWRCVDLRTVFGAPGLPDPDLFHDYCHLSGPGIERAMAAVADAVTGSPPGTTAPGPGPDRRLRAFGHAHAAAHIAFQGQPVLPVLNRLRAAVDADPGAGPVLAGTLALLDAPRPLWTHPAALRLAEAAELLPFLSGLVQTRCVPPELWTLRECLSELFESAPGSDRDADLLESPTADGHPLPNWRPPLAYHRGMARRSVFAFALARPGDLTLAVTYRMPDAPAGTTADLLVNGAVVATLPSCPQWTSTAAAVDGRLTRRGVNQTGVRWPVPAPDPAACHRADAEALERGEFPSVLPVFGELFEARVLLRNPGAASG